jgi:hypothetical protein
MEGSSLKHTDMTNTYIAESNLSNSSLIGANIYQANISSSNFLNADFSYANMEGSTLYEVELTGANLKGANLSGVIFPDAVSPDGTVRQIPVKGLTQEQVDVICYDPRLPPKLPKRFTLPKVTQDCLLDIEVKRVSVGAKPGERFYAFKAQFEKDGMSTQDFREAWPWNGSYHKYGSVTNHAMNIPEWAK